MTQAIRMPCLGLPGHWPWKPVVDEPGRESGKAQPAAWEGPGTPPPTPTATATATSIRTPNPAPRPGPAGTEMACRSEEGSDPPQRKEPKLASSRAADPRWGRLGVQSGTLPWEARPAPPPRGRSRHPWIPHRGSERRGACTLEPRPREREEQAGWRASTLAGARTAGAP